MPKKLPAYILVVVIGVIAILIAAFGKFGGTGYIDPNQETVTGEIGSFPPGFTGIETTTAMEDPFTMAPTPDYSGQPSGITVPVTETTAQPSDGPGGQETDPTDPSSDSEGPSQNETPDVPSETTPPAEETTAPPALSRNRAFFSW